MFDIKEVLLIFSDIMVFCYIKNGSLLEKPSEIFMGEIIWYLEYT